MILNLTTYIRSCIVLVVVLLCEFCFVLPSQASPYIKCSSQMSKRAESLLLEARTNWVSLLKHQKVFSSCDDGGLGEGYSDAVVQLLSNNWEQFSMLSDIARKNPEFKNWVVLHVDATAADEDLKKILENTATCVNQTREGYLCKSIRQAAENALTELGRIHQ